ncbi:MAG: FtsX-like permease family protein [Roseiarcus sp.]|jgi:putative ABC transport system permease protein
MSEPAAAPSRRLARFVLARLAFRDLRGGLAGLRIFLVCIALGVAAIVAVNSLACALQDGMARDGRTILGGDASFSLIHRQLSSEERAFLQSRGALSTIATMRAMARNEAGEAALVELKAVDQDWPRIGQAVFEPAMAPNAALAKREDRFGAAVESTLLDRLGLKIGDAFDLGAAHFEVRAELVSEPDRLATGVGLGPRVLISQDALAASGLVQPGSLVRWTTRVLLSAGGAPPNEAAVVAFVDEAKAAFPEAGWETRTRSNVSPEFSRDLDRFGEFLALVGLISLVVGGVGVANAAQGFVERKRASLAILKALGASGGAVVALALIEFLVVALIGVVAGLAIGAATPFAVAALFAPVLPLPLAPAVYPGEIALGALYGVLTAFVFAIAPLGRAHDVPVSQLFRNLVETRAAPPRLRYLGATALGGATLAAVAILAGPQRTVAIVVVVATTLALLALRLVAAGAMALARRAPRARSVAWRMAIANLHRPGALTPSVVLSLGLGLAVLVALTLVDSNLRGELRRATPGETPSFYFLDVRSADIAAFRGFLGLEAPQARIVEAPMMRGRVVRIGDVPAASFKAKEGVAWVLEGDRGVTFADAPPEGSKVVAGRWWPADYSGPPLVSLETGVAEGLGVKIGDTITLNVLGREITATIYNLRKVNWRSFGINFVFVFTPGAFKGAPYTVLVTAALPNGADEGALMKAAARDFPSIAAVRVRDALEAIEALTAKLALAIRSASGIALTSAVLVLAGALAANRRARILDAVILKILGATRGRLAATFLIEYALLGAATAAFGVAAGTLAAYVIVARVMGLDFVFAPAPAFAAAAAGLALTVALGMIGAWRILGQKPAAFLREL